jgi:hypothetical protein
MTRNLVLAMVLFGGLVGAVSAAEPRNSNHETIVYDATSCSPLLVHEAGYQPIVNARPANYVPRITYHRPPANPPFAARNGAADVAVGSTVTARLNFLGSDQGFVLLKLGQAVFQCRVTGWSASEVTFEVPDMGLAQAVAAELQVVRPTGIIVKSYAIQLVRKAELVVHEVPAPSPSEGTMTAQATAVTNGLVLSAPNSGTIQQASLGD